MITPKNYYPRSRILARIGRSTCHNLQNASQREAQGMGGIELTSWALSRRFSAMLLSYIRLVSPSKFSQSLRIYQPNRAEVHLRSRLSLPNPGTHFPLGTTESGTSSFESSLGARSLLTIHVGRPRSLLFERPVQVPPCNIYGSRYRRRARPVRGLELPPTCDDIPCCIGMDALRPTSNTAWSVSSSWPSCNAL